LRNHQTKLDVVGNNIANVNTVGFKSETVRFQDIFNQTLKGASAPAAGRGGTNPVQVGLGMNISAITTMHNQGAITSTGRETDLAIEGNGFFIVNGGGRDFYTRDGTFTRDPSGELVNAAGLKVMGWMAEISYIDEDGNPVDPDDPAAIVVYKVNNNGPLSAIDIPLGEDMLAKATENMVFAGNLNSNMEVGDTYDYITYFYDSLGNRYSLIFTFEKTDANEWSYEAEFINAEGDVTSVTVSTDPITFTPGGKFYFDPANPPEFTLEIDAADLGPDVGARNVYINLDFSNLNQLSDENAVVNKGNDGYPAGEMVAFNIEQSGVVTGVYANGLMRVIGQIAMATFANPEGLMKLGGNLYDATTNSGDPRVGAAGTMDRGLIQSRAYEMSNVDLAFEFTEMITTSRGYQANARMISTSDEMLIELINIKR
jgi:flagellar hook protein FlgE